MGGNAFTLVDGENHFLVGFYPDETGTMRFAVVYTSYVPGGYYAVVERSP